MLVFDLTGRTDAKGSGVTMPYKMPDPNLPAKVIEIRCPCRRGFSIRTQQPSMTKPCNSCGRNYIVRIYTNGTVTVHYIEPQGFVEETFTRENWSDVTEGE